MELILSLILLLPVTMVVVTDEDARDFVLKMGKAALIVLPTVFGIAGLIVYFQNL